MRGYYTIINGVPYELTKMPLTQASPIVGEEGPHVEVSPIPVDKTLTVNITDAHLSKDSDTNKALAKAFTDYLKEQRILDIQKVTNHFNVYVEYVLYDNICNAQVAHDVAVKDVCPQTFLFPLGLTDEDEYVARFGYQLQAEIVQRYRAKHPFGTLHPGSGNSYTLTITRIYVTTMLERAYSLAAQRKAPEPNHVGHYIDHTVEYAHNDYHRNWGGPYGMCKPALTADQSHNYYHHPSCSDMSYVVKDFMLDPRDNVIIYDSLWNTPEGETAGPVYSVTVQYAPETIILHFTFKSIMLTLMSAEKVAATLSGNKEIIDAEEAAKNPGAGSGTIGGDSTVTPPVENAPLEGDDKDVADTQTPTQPTNPPTTDVTEGTSSETTGGSTTDTTTEETGSDTTGSTTPEETTPGTEEIPV